MATHVHATKKRRMNVDAESAPEAKRSKDKNAKRARLDPKDFVICDGSLWSPATLPKPNAGHVLIHLFRYTKSSSTCPFPVDLYWIPVKDINDECWEMMTAAHNFIYSIEDPLHYVDLAEAGRLYKTFSSSKTKTLLTLLSEDPFRDYKLFSNVMPVFGKAAAVIVTGIFCI